MSDKMAVEVMGRVPIHFLAYIVFSGGIFIVFSPVRLYLIPLDIFPFSENLLSNFGALSIFTLLSGVILLLLKEPFCGTGGVHDWINRKRKLANSKEVKSAVKKKQHLTNVELKLKPVELAPFLKWAKETEIYTQLQFINIEAFMLSAFMVSAETGSVLNIAGLIGGFLNISNQLSSSIWILAFNLFVLALIFVCSWSINKFWFRDRKAESLDAIGKGFHKCFCLPKKEKI